MSDRILGLFKEDLMGRGLIMEITNRSTILGRFISKEIEDIYIKYSSITKEEEHLVARLVEKIGNHNIDFDPFQDYDQTRALAALQGEEGVDVIKLYLLLTSELSLSLELEDVRNHCNELVDRGYRQIDKYLFFYDYGEDQLKSIAEEILADELEDADYALELFDPEEITYMWIFQTPLVEAAKQFVEAAKQFIEDNGWFEAFQIEDLGVAYQDKDGREVSFCINEEDYLFR